MAAGLPFGLLRLVSSTAPGFPDWRDGDAYRPLLEVDKAGFAWEWLRRNPLYQTAVQEASGRGRIVGAVEPAAAAWGLHGFADYRNGIFVARPCWRAADHPLVLKAALGSEGVDADTAVLGSILDQANILSGERTDHLVLSDGPRSLRIDLDGRWRTRSPRRVQWRLDGLADARVGVMLLTQLVCFARHRRFTAAYHAPHRQARRLVMALRASDALAAGASQRDIAAQILSTAAQEPRWRVETPSVRLQAQRLVRAARRLGVGWRALLQP